MTVKEYSHFGPNDLQLVVFDALPRPLESKNESSSVGEMAFFERSRGTHKVGSEDPGKTKTGQIEAASQERLRDTRQEDETYQRCFDHLELKKRRERDKSV